MNRLLQNRRAAVSTTLSRLVMSLAVIGLFGASEALAGDAKSYSGSDCVPTNSTTVPITSQVTYAHAGFRIDANAIVNRAGGDRVVVCPVVRDLVDDDADDVQISILDDGNPAGTDDTECCFIAWTLDGLDFEVTCESADDDLVGDDRRQIIEIDEPGIFELGDDFDDGYYRLECLLENEEELFGYRIWED